MSKIAIYPGTFDPITNGHIDLIQRTLKIFDEIIVAVASSQQKESLFSSEERLELITQAVRDLKGAQAELFDSLLVDYAQDKESIAIVRGLRAVSDFEYELQMALMNRRLNSSI
ncbi:MAG: pantetheine-phosphate adenylyltransferase, partial [Thermodesulfovibrionia bacterium]|nr:pantetheine-phosphate adenylyltransferase [Thermodesulfovibrionia bacterium]